MRYLQYGGNNFIELKLKSITTFYRMPKLENISKHMEFILSKQFPLSKCMLIFIQMLFSILKRFQTFIVNVYSKMKCCLSHSFLFLKAS